MKEKHTRLVNFLRTNYPAVGKRIENKKGMVNKERAVNPEDMFKYEGPIT